MAEANAYDLVIVGGGINGAGIAADAAGRGLKVLLAEMNDLASATSSKSSKLIHGGLRYLEYYEFRLVREALAEREVLLAKAPHIIWPMRFVLPQVGSLRPAWMIQAGLFLYDHLYRRRHIPGSQRIDLTRDPAGEPLKPKWTQGFSYFDCWVDDARLVILNAIQARQHGADILTGARVVAAHRVEDHWNVDIRSNGRNQSVRAAALVNAAGPWVDQIDQISQRRSTGEAPARSVRLVKGSHIVVPRIAGANDAYLLQNSDKRVVFSLPYEHDYTLIGTTDISFDGDPAAVAIDSAEERYLIELAGIFFRTPLRVEDIVWRYSGVRPLFDDHSDNPSAVTRDYTLVVDAPSGQAPRLSIYGGKITTYRRLAEEALDRLRPYLPHMRSRWTASNPLPGGDIPQANFESFLNAQIARLPKFDPTFIRRLARRHGSGLSQVLGDARSQSDLGIDFGAGLTEREVIHFKEAEWARNPDDILWRRTKAGLHLSSKRSPGEFARIEEKISRLL